MLKDRFRDVFNEYKTLSPQDDYEMGICWKKGIEILSENILDTVAFCKDECTADEFVFMSSFFSEVVEETQSKDFIDCLNILAEKYPEECKEYYILDFIKDAENYLD